MSSVDITSVVVQAKSEGLDELNTKLSSLVTTGAKAEKAVGDFSAATKTLAAGQASNVSIDEKILAQYRKKADLMGAATAQSNAYTAAMKGAGSAAQSMAVFLGAEVDAFKAKAAAASKAASEEARNKAAADSFMQSLQRQADTIGMTSKQLKEYNANLLETQARTLGVSGPASTLITQIKDKTAALKDGSGAHEKFNLLTAGSAREMMVLGHEMSQGSFQRFGGSLIVLAERINFLPALLKGATEFAGALGISLGALATGFLATAGAAAVYGFALMHNREQAIEMNNALILTGGFAGTTSAGLLDIAKSATEMGGSFGETKKAVIELAGVGKFTADQIGMIAGVAAGLEKTAGIPLEKTIERYKRLAVEAVNGGAKSLDLVSKSAVEQNNVLHNLTAAQYENIVSLERQGKAHDALALLIKINSDANKQNILDMEAGLSDATQTIHALTKAISGWFNSIGEGETVAARQAAIKAQIKNVEGSFLMSEKVKADTLLHLRTDLAFSIAAVAEKARQAELVGKDKELQQDLIAGQMRLRANAQANAKELTATEKLEREKRDFAAQSDTYRIAHKQEYLDTIASLEKKAAGKQAKPENIGLSGVDAQLKAIDAVDSAQVRAYNNEIRLLNIQEKYKEISAEEAAGKREKILDAQYLLLKNQYAKQFTVLESFHTAKARLENNADTRKSALEEKSNKLEDDNRERVAANMAKALFDSKSGERAQQDAADASYKTNAKEIDALKDRVAAYASLSDAMKAVGVTDKQMKDSVTQSTIDRLEAEKDLATTTVSRIMLIDRELAQLREKKALQTVDEGNHKTNADALAGPAAQKAAASLLEQQWKNTGAEISKSLTSAFGNAGKAMGSMFKIYADGNAMQVKLLQQRSEAENRVGATAADKAKASKEYAKASGMAQMAQYGDMASAAQGFFNSQQEGYKVLGSISKAFHLVEMALQMEDMAAKLFGTTAVTTAVVTGVGVQVAAGTAATAASVAQSEVTFAAAAPAAIAKAGSQTGWYGAIAMAAVMAALGFASGAAGSTEGPNSAASVQKAQGTGSVLGDATAKSDSIAKSLALLSSNSNSSLPVSNQMAVSLRNIDGGISSLTNTVLRTAGISIGATLSPDGLGKSSLLGSKVDALTISPFDGLTAKITGSITKSLTDGGLQFGGSIGSLQQGDGVNAYANVHKHSSGLLGLFSKDSDSTLTGGVSNDVKDAFGKVFTNLQSVMVLAATDLGKNGVDVGNAIKSYTLATTKISLQGLSGADQQKAISEVLSKAMDDIVTSLYPQLEEFQQVGEGLLQTLTRVSNDFVQVKGVFATLGKSFTQVGVEGIKTSEDLINAAGGLEKLTSGTKFFSDNFMTDAERQAPILASVKAAFADLGVTGIDTADKFKALVLAQDLTTQGGQQMYGALLNIAPAFKKITDYTDKLVTDAQALEDFRKSLLQGGLSPLSPQEKYNQQKATTEAIVAAAAGGDTVAQGKQQQAITDFLTASQVVFASSAQYQQDFSWVQKALSSQVAMAGGVNGSHANGLPNVPFDGYRAELHKGERVLTASQNIDYNKMGTSNMAPLVEEIKSLREELKGLREDQHKQTGALIQSNDAANTRNAQEVVAGTKAAIQKSDYVKAAAPTYK